MKSLYETDNYEALNPTWHEEDSPWKARQVEKIIRSNRLVFNSACEIGCGTGEILLNLSRSFPDATFDGYEIAPRAYERAKLKETDKVKFHLSDVVATQGTSYDIVVVADVIEHVEDYVSFIKKIKDVGRYKILHIPLDLSVQSVLRKSPIINLRASVGHIHYFFKDTALATLVDCGYTIIDHVYTASRLELPNQALSSRIMALPRRMMYSINADLAVRVLGGYSLLVLAE